MTTYNTGNPVGSTDARDLYDNSQALDELVNGSGTYSNRLGVQRRTLAKLEADFDAQLADAESDLNVYRSEAAASAAEAFGYLQAYRATSYGALASDPATDPLGNPPTVGDEYFNTTANLLKRWNGTTWQASDINTANLAASSGSSLVGYDGGTVQDVLDGAKSLQDYAALRAYTGRAKRVYITGLLVAKKPIGVAGYFQYDPTDTTSLDNGGTIIVLADGRRFKRDYVGELNVAWFEAACNGETDDWPAIQAANEYLKANGGGTLYFPGWCLINQPFYHYGSVDGGWSIAYPSPNQAKITWKSNGQGGIKVGSGITSGDVIRLSKPSTSTALNYMVGFSNFAIDCSGKNVTALNGFSYSGIYGANHIISVDGLYINGIQGADAIGVDFGTITDSEIHRLRVQGYGTGPYAGVRLNKANIQLHSYTATFCKHSIVVGSLTEACIQMFGGSLLAPKQSHIHWESASADYKSSASVIVGAFIGETNTTPTTAQGPIMSCASPSNLDIGVITFIGCGFDNWTGSTNMINIDWGGRFNFIGCNAWSAATGNKSIKFGQYCYALMFNNKEIAVDTSGAGAIAGQVQGNFQAEAVAFTPALAATGSTFSYSSRNGYYTRVGNLVTVSIRIQLNTSGNTFTGNALTITGLPFPISDKTFSHTAVPAEWFSTATPMTGVTGLLVQNSSTLAMYKKTAATTSSFATTLLDTDIGATTGGGLYASFTYQVAPGY